MDISSTIHLDMSITSTTADSTAWVKPATMPWSLDTRRSDALWRQLHTELLRKLRAGDYAKGSNLPSERELASELGVSRITVKRCYDELRREGWLSTGSGRGGSTVMQPLNLPDMAVRSSKDLSQEMQEANNATREHVILREVVHDRLIASVFGLPSNAWFLHLVRLRFGGDSPITRENAWYDLALAPALADWDGQGSASDVLREQSGLSLLGVEQTVEAVLSTEEEARDFGLHRALPCLLFKRRTRAGANQQLVAYAEALFRGDRYVYRTPWTM